MITCEFEGGNKANLRHTTVDGIIVRDGRILMTKRAPHLIHGGKWAFPGGYMERDETIAEALAREVKEETGWEIGAPTLMTIHSNIQFAGDDRQNVRFVYMAEATEQTGQPDDESTEQQWFLPTELPPVSDIAFDHFELIQFYQSHQRLPRGLPLVV